jgi:hypothetical protein
MGYFARNSRLCLLSFGAHNLNGGFGAKWIYKIWVLMSGIYEYLRGFEGPLKRLERKLPRIKIVVV